MVLTRSEATRMNLMWESLVVERKILLSTAWAIQLYTRRDRFFLYFHSMTIRGFFLAGCVLLALHVGIRIIDHSRTIAVTMIANQVNAELRYALTLEGISYIVMGGLVIWVLITKSEKLFRLVVKEGEGETKARTGPELNELVFLGVGVYWVADGIAGIASELVKYNYFDRDQLEGGVTTLSESTGLKYIIDYLIRGFVGCWLLANARWLAIRVNRWQEKPSQNGDESTPTQRNP